MGKATDNVKNNIKIARVEIVKMRHSLSIESIKSRISILSLAD